MMDYSYQAVAKHISGLPPEVREGAIASILDRRDHCAKAARAEVSQSQALRREVRDLRNKVIADKAEWLASMLQGATDDEHYMRDWDAFDEAVAQGLKHTPEITGRQYLALADYLRERFVPK
jgi:hypothetical protein